MRRDRLRVDGVWWLRSRPALRPVLPGEGLYLQWSCCVLRDRCGGDPMSEPLTPEREAQIRELMKRVGLRLDGYGEFDALHTLLAEVDRLRTELAAAHAQRDEAALLRDFHHFHLDQVTAQRMEAEVAHEAWELSQITAEEALRRTDAAIQEHRAVSLAQFRAEREATS